ncbi:MAG: SAM-dependent chlorinase/fluorinase [Planctomycetes bacterium]|nr:SAM-dependent chlorinase/fluorinase [Planctomycetota bacterium]
MAPRPTGIVTLLTDFGTVDPYVGVLKGAVLRANPRAVLVDLGHAVPPQDVQAGAFWMAAAIGRFPAGTVHVGVVDPGVGTPRRLLAVAAGDCFWLAPDNGLLAAVLRHDPDAEVRVLEPAHLGLRDISRTFHGRDVLAPVAGWLGCGRYGFSALGPRVADAERGVDPFAGAPRVVHVDAYGNLVSNVPAARLEGVAAVGVGGRRVRVRGTYAEVPVGELLALVGSYGLLEIAENGGNAANSLGLQRGAPIDLLAG